MVPDTSSPFPYRGTGHEDRCDQCSDNAHPVAGNDGGKDKYGISLAAIYAGAGADAVDKTFGQSDAWSAASKATDGVLPDKWSSDGYNEWKENTWKAPVGSSW